MRAAIYIRVSTEEQARHGFSLSEQSESCRSRALEIGALEVLEYSDEGVSGASLDRPGLSALRDAARSGQFNCLVIRDPDRLSRRLAHQLLLSEEFEKCGVRLEFLDFDWKDTPEGRLFYSIKGAVAEYEREKIRERMTRGKRQKAKLGGIPVNFDVYGYSYSPKTGVISVLENEALVVRDIFYWYTTEDTSLLGLAGRLNRMGIPTRRRSGCWHRQVVRQILMNSVYVGEWHYGKSLSGPEQVIIIPVPAIIEPSLWYAAGKKLAQTAHRRNGRGKRQYLLSGLLTCGDCATAMHGCFTVWWGKAERRYTCRKNRGSLSGCRPAKYFPAGALENAVWQKIKEILPDPHMLFQEAASSLPFSGDTQRELVKTKKELLETVKGQSALLETLATGLATLDRQTRVRLANLQKRRIYLEKQIIGLESTAAQRGCLEPEEMHAAAARVVSGLDNLGFDDKSSLLRTIVDKIVVTGRIRRTGKLQEEINIMVASPSMSGKITETEETAEGECHE